MNRHELAGLMKALRYLGLAFVLSACTGCVEAVTLGLILANEALTLGTIVRDATQGPATTAMCAKPGEQAVLKCTDAPHGYERVEFRDGEWRPITVDLEAKP